MSRTSILQMALAAILAYSIAQLPDFPHGAIRAAGAWLWSLDALAFGLLVATLTFGLLMVSIIEDWEWPAGVEEILPLPMAAVVIVLVRGMGWFFFYVNYLSAWLLLDIPGWAMVGAWVLAMLLRYWLFDIETLEPRKEFLKVRSPKAS